MAHKLISKAEAKKQGLKTYYTGQPCDRGHYAERYTNSGKCIECHKARNASRKRGKTGNKATKGKVAVAATVVAVAPITGDWRSYAEQITVTWRQAAASFIETGKLLNKAKAEVPHGDWLKLVEELPFGEDTAERLMAIARHPVISNSAHVRYLPPSYSTLYVLTKLDDQVLLAKIKDGSIFPEMLRRNAEAIVAASVAKKEPVQRINSVTIIEPEKTAERVVVPVYNDKEWPTSLPEPSDEATDAEIVGETPSPEEAVKARRESVDALIATLRPENMPGVIVELLKQLDRDTQNRCLLKLREVMRGMA